MKCIVSICSALLFAAVGSAQSYVKVNKCVIENGVLKTIVTDYDPAKGDYYVTVNGSQKGLDLVYPEIGKDYAMSTSWYANTNTITVYNQKYSKYGYPRILETGDIVKRTMYNQIGVYAEPSAGGTPEVIYIPTRRGCEFQPYQIVNETANQKKIYYERNWSVTTNPEYAAYYRLVTVDAAGKPVGLVKDFYITGEKQWEGAMSYLDPYDNSNDIPEGPCTWYHKNGKKASEVNMLHGKYNGVYKSWTETGAKESEIEYKKGVLHGQYKTWYPNGRPANVGQYVNGQYNGKQIAYLEDGRISYQETYVLGRPSKPCYDRLDANGQVYKVCADFFSKQTNAFTWKYSGSAAAKHSIDEEKGLQLKSNAGIKSIAFFDLPADPKGVENINTTFTVVAEEDDAEYGLVWNFVDTANFNYFVMSNDGWWSAGKFKDGQRYGLEQAGTVKMSRGEYWNPTGSPQSIAITPNSDGWELWLNDNPIYSTGSQLDIKQKSMGVITMGKAIVYFNKFGASYRKK